MNAGPFPMDGPSDGASAVGADRREQRDRRAPAVFISHGSPLAIVEEDFKQALRRFGARLRPPRAVLVVSAHWQGMRPLRVTGHPRPASMHDYEGFPAWLDSLSYRCPGASDVAARAAALLGAAGLDAVVDPSRGLDSGTWMPLSLMYPSAKVPVTQLSLPAPVSPDDMLAIGAALAPLRRSGVVLLGSGGLVNNEARMRFDIRNAPTEPWARAFDQWMAARIEAQDLAVLREYRARAPMAHLAAPTSEHLDPLFFVMGAALRGDVISWLAEGFHGGNLSLRSFVLAGRRLEDHRLPDEFTIAPPTGTPTRGRGGV